MTRRERIGGCDSSCVLQKPKGMATNGGCRCLPKGGHWTREEQREVRRLFMLIGQELKPLWAIKDAAVVEYETLGASQEMIDALDAYQEGNDE